MLIQNTILLWGRVSVASTTARWSSRVGSTEHPECRSYLSDKSESTGPLQDHESPIIRPHGVGLIASFNIPKYPRGKATGGIHTLGRPRAERAVTVLEPCVTRADGYRGPSVQMYNYGNGLPNSRSQCGKPMVERTRTSWDIQQEGNLLTIGGREHTKSRVITTKQGK